MTPEEELIEENHKMREALGAWMHFARHQIDRGLKLPLWSVLLWDQAIEKTQEALGEGQNK